MKNYFGSLHHDDPANPVALAERAKQQGWALTAITCEEPDGTMLLDHYKVRCAETGEHVHNASAQELSHTLAAAEERDVERALRYLVEGWTLAEAPGPLGGRLGFVVVDDDGNHRIGTFSKPESAVQIAAAMGLINHLVTYHE